MCLALFAGKARSALDVTEAHFVRLHFVPAVAVGKGTCSVLYNANMQGRYVNALLGAMSDASRDSGEQQLVCVHASLHKLEQHPYALLLIP